MAIVKMDKISLIGLQRDRNEIIDSLMRMGVVQIEDIDADNSENGLSDLITKSGDEEKVIQLDTQIEKIKAAIDYLSGFSTKKKGFFESKRVVDKNELNEIIKNESNLWDIVKNIDSLNEQLALLRSDENRLSNLIASLEPWENLRIPVEVTSTKYTIVTQGVVPVTADTEALKNELAESAPQSYFERVNRDKDQSYISIIYHISCEAVVTEILKKYGFSKVSFSGLTGTPAANIANARRQIAEIKEKRNNIQKKIKEFAGSKGKLEVLHDYLEIQRDKVSVLSKMAKTDKTFILEGWLPSEKSSEVKSAISQNWECVLEIRPSEEGEEHPILLRNNSLVRPFEIITEMYSLPNAREVDPNAVMAPFYFLFFGMMVSDAGYGLVIALATGIILKKFKLQGMAHKMVSLLFFGGISTFIWGAMFGGWFGDVVSAVTSGKYTIPPIWFNPLDDPIRLLIWSFIFGALHIFAGMGIKAYMLIKDGKVLDVLFDIIPWYMVLIGLGMLAAGGIIAAIGKYMAIIGAGVLVLTQGRPEKNIIKRLFKGILSLYGVTGYLSDILSYSRLLALGLSTGVVATVINTMGTLFGFNIAGIIIFLVVFIIGTVFNIAINALGAYVHTSRLQYVEFFGKFYEGGGKGYEPFKIKTKYTNININDGRQSK